MQAAAPNIEEFDLTDNLISGWKFVSDLYRELPKLVHINLSHNRLSLPMQPEDFGYPDAMQLHSLVLNSCCVTWQQILVLQAHLPQLKELHICNNAIADLSALDKGPHRLVGFQQLQVGRGCTQRSAGSLQIGILP